MCRTFCGGVKEDQILEWNAQATREGIVVQKNVERTNDDRKFRLREKSISAGRAL
jgi:hypothetical protein